MIRSWKETSEKPDDIVPGMRTRTVNAVKSSGSSWRNRAIAVVTGVLTAVRRRIVAGILPP